MIMNVLPIAAEHGLPVTWCVLNDRALGSILDGQRAAFGNRIIATTFEVQPDFATIAEACQCHGERVDDPDEVRPALERALRRQRPRRPGGASISSWRRSALAGSVDFFAKR